MRNYIKKRLMESYIMDIDDEDDDEDVLSSENYISDYSGGYPSIAADDYNTRIVLTLATPYFDSEGGAPPKWFTDNEETYKEAAYEFFDYTLLEILDSNPCIRGYGDWKFCYEEFYERRCTQRINPPHNMEGLPYYYNGEKAFFNPGHKYVNVSLKTKFRTPWQVLRFLNSFFRLRIDKNNPLVDSITMIECNGEGVYYNVSRSNNIRINGCSPYTDSLYNFVYHLLPQGKMLYTYLEISGESEFDKLVYSMFHNEAKVYSTIDRLDDYKRLNRVKLYDAFPMRALYMNTDWKTLDNVSKSNRLEVDDSSEEVFDEFKKWFESYRGECRFYLYSSYGQFGYLCFLKDTFCYKDKEFIVGFFEFTNCNGNAYEENADFFMDMADMLDETPQRLLDEFDDVQLIVYSVRKIIRERFDDAEMDD